jgi:hypothetical protein
VSDSDELITIPNVTLIKVGAWPAHGNSPGMSNEVVFTEEDLRNIIAAMECPDVKEPRMILGHTGPTAPAGMSAVADEGFFGEQPAIGKFINCALSSDGQEITGDLAGVPAWLAKILPTAYPNRSTEVYWDVPSGIPGAPNHACIMPRVALLGTGLPAVATLEDLRVFFSEDGPDIPEPEMSKASRHVAAMNGGQMSLRAAASVQVEDVRREFYNNFATEASGRYWWWITAMYADPQILIVDDEEESLWSVPYEIKGDDVEFGEPVQIKVQYVEEESGKVAAARMSAAQTLVSGNKALGVEAEQVYDKAATSRPEDRKPRKEQATMGIDIAALRERTGLTAEQLPDDATEEQVNAALSAPAAPEGGAGEQEEHEEDAPAGAGESEEQPAGAAAASSTVTVDREAWEESQRTQAALKADLDKRTAESRESKVTAAIKAGKIPRSRKDHYVQLMTADPKGTEELLDKMEANVIPVDETGVDADPAAPSAEAGTGYDTAWLTDAERARVEAARGNASGERSRLVLEG